jgi:hypothetical protein
MSPMYLVANLGSISSGHQNLEARSVAAVTQDFLEHAGIQLSGQFFNCPAVLKSQISRFMISSRYPIGIPQLTIPIVSDFHSCACDNAAEHVDKPQ